MFACYRNRWLRALVPGLLISLSLSAQQPVVVASAQPSNTQPSNTQEDIAALKSQLAAQQQQLEQLRAALQKQQDAIEKATKQVEAAEMRRVVPAASLGEVASTTPILPMPAVAVPPMNPAYPMTGARSQAGASGESPLSFKIGAANFTPLGFVDFIDVTRSTNAGGALGTGFGSIPFSNTAAGGLSETRFSMQNSRLGMRVDSNVGNFKVMGYVEADFLGNAPNGLYVTSNSDTLRMRLFFVDLKSEMFEITAGQTWSLMTPDRNHIGVLPADLFYSQDIDTNYQNGLTWARQTGFRFNWTPNSTVSWATSLENPEQYAGSALALPKNLAANTGFVGEVSNGTLNTVPNLFPDVISKVAFDGGEEGHKAHLEIAGVLSSYKTFNPLTTGPGADTRFTKVGGGAAVNFNFELARGFRIISNNFASDGAGRYIANSGAPDFIIRANGSPSLVRAVSTVDGFEYQATKKVLFYAYYGGVYVGKNTALDTDNKTVVGYGFTGGSTSANRTIQEATFGLSNNFWKSPQYGALTLAFQYSYLTRNPWSIVTAGAPTNADFHMGYVDLRYTLP